MNTDQNETEVLPPEQAAQAKALVRHQHIPVAQMQQGPLSGAEMTMRLALIADVMKTAMKEGQDYGKVPGCGDKPGLFQPGAQKLSMMFQLNPEVQTETINDYPGYHRGFRFVVRVSNGAKFADGVGECSTLESKYRYRSAGKKCPECGKETIIKGKEQYGGGWLCFEKKGGCGWKCKDGTPAAEALMGQDSGKMEHENPPDFWNTVRKMAFKRAFVHAIINATNTSELWSQDLEDLAANGVVTGEREQERKERPKAPKQRQERREPPEDTPPKDEKRKEPPATTQAGVSKGTAVLLESWTKLPSKPGQKGHPWTLYTGNFVSSDGDTDVRAISTFDDQLGQKLASLEGQECDITFKPGRREGTLELLTIEQADDLPG